MSQSLLSSRQLERSVGGDGFERVAHRVEIDRATREVMARSNGSDGLEPVTHRVDSETS